MSPRDMADHDRVFGQLAQRTRDLMVATMRSQIAHADAEEISATLEELTVRLLEHAAPGALGIQVDDDGTVRNHGNTVVGLRNPMAPPLQIDQYPDGRASSSFRLGPLHEGPPGLAHGGVSALILDQMLGEAAAAGGSPGMTGRLVLSFRRPTPLGELSAEAWIDRVDGIKTTVKGHILDAEGLPTVEAEGLFIQPRWARAATEGSQRPTAFV